MRRFLPILLVAVGSGLLWHNVASTYLPGPEITVQLEKLTTIDNRIPRTLVLREIKSRVRLPASIWSQVDATDMAEPGGRFDAGCIRTPGVPRHRLIFGGMGDDYFIVYYESGGYAHSFTTELFHREGTNWHMMWHSYALEMQSLSQLTEKLSTLNVAED